MMTPNVTPEQGISNPEAQSSKALIVEQPHKLEGLLETISLLDSISERVGEDKSGDMGDGGGSTGKRDDGSAGGQSARDLAIANLADEKVLRKQLAQHIEREVKTLSKQVHRAAKRISKPGNAHKLNELYARIRRLNSLLSSLVEASYDVVKRLFIRVFIDKQPIL